jgi:hypothetical protein
MDIIRFPDSRERCLRVAKRLQQECEELLQEADRLLAELKKKRKGEQIHPDKK